ILAVDEWHELLGSKRGVQVELAISRIVNLIDRSQPTDDFSENRHPSSVIHHLSVWGISATIGNLDQAQEVLVSSVMDKIKDPPVIVKAKLDKRIEIESVFPDEIEK